MDKAIKGIKCDAASCVHHAEGDLCTADCIQVCYHCDCGCTGTEANCETYEKK